MVFTLQRYIFRELFKVFALATIGLTLILSLGGVLQPVQEYGVGPKQVVHILVYFMPITLTFVLPMAALFASALAYGRFASDNELDACRASGISLLTLVYPGLVLAILVAIANLVLSFHVMPHFVHLAEKALKADAKQILFRNIERRGFYELPPDGEYLLYADYADTKNDTLHGIVVVENERGAIGRIRTAGAARIHFDPHDRFNEIRLDVFDARQMRAMDTFWGVIGKASVTYEFGSLLGDDIKFKKVNEMKQIRANLLLFDPISKAARAAYSQLAVELLAQDIARTLARPEDGVYRLVGPDRFIVFSAKSCGLPDKKTVGLVGPIRAEEFDSSGRRLRTLTCNKAVILADEDVTGPGLVLTLSQPQVEETGQRMMNYIVGDLAMPKPLTERLHRAGLLETTVPEGASSVLGSAPSSMLDGLQRDLVKKIKRTGVSIKAEMNSRLVFGLGCVPMIMIGIGLGIINRGGHLLSAFGASCLPSAVLIVAIISGKHVTENKTAQGVSGILIMWAGLAALTVLAAWLYAKLSRN